MKVTFSLSTDPNPDWKWLFAPRDEIHAYWKKLSTKHQVDARIEYGSELVSAVWSEKHQHYTLTIRDVETQTARQVTAQVVISAIGVFHVPRWPSIPGRELFKGDMLHAQHWDHTVDLSGKRVAVIGNGCAG
jgi:cation diffusion facilitator CzcD-associated flavoprotein CzcO